MKVGDKKPVDGINDNDAVRITRSERRSVKADRDSAASGTNSQNAAAEVNVSLASEIAQQLNPDQILKDHQAHVERIKKLVQSGQYQTPDKDGAEFLARLVQRIDDERQLIAGFVDDGEKT